MGKTPPRGSLFSPGQIAREFRGLIEASPEDRTFAEVEAPLG